VWACPIPYFRICTLCAQSDGPGSDKPPSSLWSSTAGFGVLPKASSSSPELYPEGVFRVFPWLHRGCEVLTPRVVESKNQAKSQIGLESSILIFQKKI
jgi:hypothetical protein